MISNIFWGNMQIEIPTGFKLKDHKRAGILLGRWRPPESILLLSKIHTPDAMNAYREMIENPTPLYGHMVDRRETFYLCNLFPGKTIKETLTISISPPKITSYIWDIIIDNIFDDSIVVNFVMFGKIENDIEKWKSLLLSLRPSDGVSRDETLEIPLPGEEVELKVFNTWGEKIPAKRDSRGKVIIPVISRGRNLDFKKDAIARFSKEEQDYSKEVERLLYEAFAQEMPPFIPDARDLYAELGIEINHKTDIRKYCSPIRIEVKRTTRGNDPIIDLYFESCWNANDEFIVRFHNKTTKIICT